MGQGGTGRWRNSTPSAPSWAGWYLLKVARSLGAEPAALMSGSGPNPLQSGFLKEQHESVFGFWVLSNLRRLTFDPQVVSPQADSGSFVLFCFCGLDKNFGDSGLTGTLHPPPSGGRCPRGSVDPGTVAGVSVAEKQNLVVAATEPGGRSSRRRAENEEASEASEPSETMMTHPGETRRLMDE